MDAVQARTLAALGGTVLLTPEQGKRTGDRKWSREATTKENKAGGGPTWQTSGKRGLSQKRSSENGRRTKGNSPKGNVKGMGRGQLGKLRKALNKVDLTGKKKEEEVAVRPLDFTTGNAFDLLEPQEEGGMDTDKDLAEEEEMAKERAQGTGTGDKGVV